MLARVWADLHVHSAASFDGDVQPIRLVELARERGLTHVAITDHDTIEGAIAARQIASASVTVIVGQEVRTSEGDLIVLYVDRRIPSGLTPEQTVALAHEQEAIVGLAHPFDVYRPSIGRGAVRPAELARLAALADYVEVHNGRVIDLTPNARAADFAREYDLPQVAVSDTHTEPELGQASTIFDLPIESAGDLRAALEHGGTLRVRQESVVPDDDRGRGLRGLLDLLRR